MKKIILFLLVLLLIPNKVNAVYEIIDSRCTTELKTTLRNEASDVVYRFARTEQNGNVLYNLYFYNSTNNLYIKDSNDNIYSNLKLENLKPGSKFNIYIYASNANYCSGYKVLTKLISVPYYNPYYGSELCEGISEYSLCREDVTVSLTKEDFEKKVKEYKESKNNNQDKEEEEYIYEKNIDIIALIIEYKYYILAVLSVILIILSAIIINNKSKNKGIL